MESVSVIGHKNIKPGNLIADLSKGTGYSWWPD